jgi:hypothetical protein
MANRLYPTHNSTHHNTFKYKLNCQEKVDASRDKDSKDWLELLTIIPHDSPNFIKIDSSGSNDFVILREKV